MIGFILYLLNSNFNLKRETMKRIVLLMFTVAVSSVLIAQQRYLDEVFTDISVTQDITYGWGWSVFRSAEDTVGTDFNGNTLYVDS